MNGNLSNPNEAPNDGPQTVPSFDGLDWLEAELETISKSSVIVLSQPTELDNVCV